LAERSMEQGERNGFFMLGLCYLHGYGCEVDRMKAMFNFESAMSAGHRSSVSHLGQLLDKTDGRRYELLARAAAEGSRLLFLIELAEEVRSFNSYSTNASALFWIGRGLNGHVDVAKRELFGDAGKFDLCIEAANQALRFFCAQTNAYRTAVNVWSIVGKRLNVVKDVRVLIGKLIWNSRQEAKYQWDFVNWKCLDSHKIEIMN
jgi:hypothetical protein